MWGDGSRARWRALLAINQCDSRECGAQVGWEELQAKGPALPSCTGARPWAWPTDGLTLFPASSPAQDADGRGH